MGGEEQAVRDRECAVDVVEAFLITRRGVYYPASRAYHVYLCLTLMASTSAIGLLIVLDNIHSPCPLLTGNHIHSHVYLCAHFHLRALPDFDSVGSF